MGMLDYSEFGTSKLGYQDQLKGLDTDLLEVMKLRAQREKAAQEASYHNAEIAQKNQLLQRQLNNDATKKHDDELKSARELQEKVNVLLANGDTEGAKALIAASGGENQAAAPATPPSAPQTAPSAPPADLPAAVRAQTPPTQDTSPASPAALPSTSSEGAGDIHLGEEPRPQDEPIRRLETPTAAQMRPMSMPGLVEAMRARHSPPAKPPEAALMRTFSPTIEGAAQTPEAPTPNPPQNPPGQMFTYKTPDGRTVTLDAEQVRSGNRKRVAQEFLDTQVELAKRLHQSAAGQPPEVAAATRREARQRVEDANRLSGYIASGVVALDQAGTQAELGVRERSGQQASSDLETRREAAALQRTRIMAAAAAQRQRASLGPVGEPDRRDLARYQADVSEIKKNTLANKDIQQLRNDREAVTHLANPNGPQFQLATDAMVKAATGGRVSVTLEQNYLKAQGMLTGIENRIYKETHGGKNMPSVVAAYRKVAKDAHDELSRQLLSDANAFEEKAGVKSHWYQRPEFRPYVLDNRRAHYEALGLPPPPDPVEQSAAAPPADSDEEFINGP